METIDTKIKAISDTKENIRNMIEYRGVEVKQSVPFKEYPRKISAIPNFVSRPIISKEYTGHADIEGLRAIGWTDEDIEYYQKTGVNWDEEEDEYHKVDDEIIALYPYITTSNYRSLIQHCNYLPKIDFSSYTSFSQAFANFYNLKAIPLLDTSSGTNFSNMFQNCHSLVSIPLLDTSSGTNFSYMFPNCHSLVSIPLLDTSSGTNFSYMFPNCHSLVSANIKGLPSIIDISSSIAKITIECILFAIYNSNKTKSSGLKLSSKNYDRVSKDELIKKALGEYPSFTLSK